MKWVGITCVGIMIFVGMLVLFPNNTSAGCNIGIKSSNSFTKTVCISPINSKVKSKGGAWTRIWKDNKWVPVKPGEKISHVYRATFGCKAKRRYTFTVVCNTNDTKNTSHAFYIPSPTGWTTNQTIDLGDLGRFCK